MSADLPVTTPIRPNAHFPPAAQPSGGDAGKLAAQRAFFEAALGRTGAPAAPAAPTPTASAQPVAAPTAAPRAAAPTATEAPTRILRPGSLIDIRV